MENATKALLIAGGVLIAVIMVSIAVYLNSLYSDQADQYSETISAVELQKFNSKFDVFIGRDNITAQEIVSVVNLAKQYNDQVEIYINTVRLQFTSSTPEDFIKMYQNDMFSCTFTTSNPTYDANGKIIKLTFKKV